MSLFLNLAPSLTVLPAGKVRQESIACGIPFNLRQKKIHDDKFQLARASVPYHTMQVVTSPLCMTRKAHVRMYSMYDDIVFLDQRY
jgi:hypothetical protein